MSISEDRLTGNALRRSFSVARRRALLIVCCALVVPVVATAISVTRPSEYRATSSVLISRQSLANQLAGSADVGLQQQSFQQVLVTQSRLARTPSVLQETVENAESVPPVTEDELERSSTVEVDPSSDLLTFSVVSEDAQRAKDVSAAYAQSYVRYKLNLDSTALRNARNDLSSAIDEARGRDESKDLIGQLESSKQQLETRLALQAANAQVVAVPSEATKVGPTPRRDALIGLLAGIVLAFVAVRIAEALDTTVRTSREVEESLGLPVLARVAERQGGDPVGIAMLDEPHGPAAEAFRILRTNLAFGIGVHDARVVMGTSASQGEGKSTTIANLAVAAALAGRKVVLVDLDLRRPRVANLFSVAGGEGITNVVVGEAKLDDVITTITLPDRRVGPLPAALSIVPTGPLPPDPAEFASSEAVTDLLRELRSRFDLVLVDAPPVTVVSDALGLLAHVDAVVLCARLGVVQRPMLRELRTIMDRVEIPVLGVVINGVNREDNPYRNYTYYGENRAGGGERSDRERLDSNELSEV